MNHTFSRRLLGTKKPYGSFDAGVKNWVVRGDVIGRLFVLVVIFTFVSVILLSVYFLQGKPPPPLAQWWITLVLIVYIPLMPYRLYLLQAALQTRTSPHHDRSSQPERDFKKQSEDPNATVVLPRYLVLAPLYQEAGVVQRLVNNLRRLRYQLKEDETADDARVEIILVVEASERPKVARPEDEKSSSLLKQTTYVLRNLIRVVLNLAVHLIVPLWIFWFIELILRSLLVFVARLLISLKLFPKKPSVPKDQRQPNTESFTLKAAVEAIMALPENDQKRFRIVEVPEDTLKGKPRALNYAFFATVGVVQDGKVVPIPGTESRVYEVVVGTPNRDESYERKEYKPSGDFDYCVVYDAEDRPEEDQLMQAALRFQNDKEGTIACLQAKLAYENLSDNWLTTLFKADYGAWFELLLPSLHKKRLPIPLGGTSNHFRVNQLRAIGGWDAYNVTEDSDLGIWLARAKTSPPNYPPGSALKYDVGILDSYTWEITDYDWKAWVRQRSRWTKGYMQTYCVHMRNPVKLVQDLGWKRFFAFQFVIGATFFLPIINPLLWLITFVYLVALVALGLGADVAIYPVYLVNTLQFYWIIPWATGSFFISNVIYFIILLIGHLKNRKPGHDWALVLLWPVYWFLISEAARRALYEYLIDPYHWEKTQHNF